MKFSFEVVEPKGVVSVITFSPAACAGRDALIRASVFEVMLALVVPMVILAPDRNEPVMVITPPDVEIELVDRDEITGSGS